MRSSSTTKSFILFVLSVVVIIGFQGCQDNSNVLGPPDFSEVPAPWDIAAAETTFTKADGELIIHVLRQGTEVYPPVTERDQVSLRYTGRTQNGTIFTSSYANGSTSPTNFSNLTPNAIGSSSSLIEGFRLGILGMYEGEKRKIVIPPSLGYGNSRQGTNGYDLRNDTLYYDIELVQING